MRTLHITDYPTCQRDDECFRIFEFLITALLALVNGDQQKFIVDTIVSEQQAVALAAAIEAIDPNEEWEITLGFLQTTQLEIEEFCGWLKKGAFEIAS